MSFGIRKRGFMAKQERIRFIDVCKGFLIIIVVLLHVFGLMMNYYYLPSSL